MKKETSDINPDMIITLLGGEEAIQSYAKNNFGRELSDIELHRFSYEALYREDDNVFTAMINLMHNLIEGVVKTEDSGWNLVDESFLEKLNPKEKEKHLRERSEIRQEKI